MKSRKPWNTKDCCEQYQNLIAIIQRTTIKVLIRVACYAERRLLYHIIFFIIILLRILFHPSLFKLSLLSLFLLLSLASLSILLWLLIDACSIELSSPSPRTPLEGPLELTPIISVFWPLRGYFRGYSPISGRATRGFTNS